ncbi:hypothetical protein NDU88_002061 [Pleurodeles waltl]|uniref:Uncharacterized protein n=1 Tax=Pleurodeles waltl TaxID=8319 RepID=A0AAV7MMP1_PLEWA|nr:hypothetical protein NDU88_002061 [Pleurodeles waltl]
MNCWGTPFHLRNQWHWLDQGVAGIAVTYCLWVRDTLVQRRSLKKCGDVTNKHQWTRKEDAEPVRGVTDALYQPVPIRRHSAILALGPGLDAVPRYRYLCVL